MSLSLSPDRTCLYRHGEPFFFLADTAWNGICCAAEADWEQYLAARAAQGFTVIQFVCTHWRAYDDEPAFTRDGGLRINDDWYARRDRLVAMIREHGLIPAPVLLWACTERDPGWVLPVEDCITVASAIKERWGGDDTIYILGGDGDYRGEKAAKWQEIGREVFAHDPRAVVTMHPGGQMWVVDEFHHEPWFSFHGYQSGHGDSEEHLRWLLDGPPTRPWLAPPVRPLINLEPNYELHQAYQSRQPFTDYHVRRAAYWSLLTAPPAGVTYGSNAIWPWATAPREPTDHEWLGVMPPWHDGLDTPGVRSMTVLRHFFEGLPWSELRPAYGLTPDPAADADPAHRIVAAATDDGSLTVLYTPVGGHLPLNLTEPMSAYWFNPRTGGTTAALDFSTPDELDWLLVLTA